MGHDLTSFYRLKPTFCHFALHHIYIDTCWQRLYVQFDVVFLARGFVFSRGMHLFVSLVSAFLGNAIHLYRISNNETRFPFIATHFTFCVCAPSVCVCLYSDFSPFQI